MTTQEGYYACGDRPLQEGDLKCAGVISPRSNIPSVSYDIFDVIIIGAGYAGLTSARDLCLSGAYYSLQNKRGSVQLLMRT